MSGEDDDEDFALFSLEPIFPGASFLAACGEEEEAILLAIFQSNFFRQSRLSSHLKEKKIPFAFTDGNMNSFRRRFPPIQPVFPPLLLAAFPSLDCTAEAC